MPSVPIRSTKPGLNVAEQQGGTYMRLYDAKAAPSARRVTIYLAEKGIEIERIDLNLKAQEQKSPEFLKKNPKGQVPVLQLDDGTFLPESAAIVEYLEEVHPNPPMLGGTLEERAHTRASERIANDLFTRMAFVLLNGSSSAAAARPGVVQVPQIAEYLQPSVDQLLEQLESRIADREFLAGRNPTIADCTLFALMEAAYFSFKYELPANYPRLRAWYKRFSERPSARI